MNAIYERGRASAADLVEILPDPPGYSAVRAFLRILEEKGHLRHTRDGARYVYEPVHPRQQVARSALAQVVRVFFDGSVERTVNALLSDADTRLSDEELERLSKQIEKARKEGR